MTVKRVLITLICLFMLSQCIYFPIAYLSKTELEWTTLPKQYPSGKFISNLGNKATLRYKNFFKDNTLDPFHSLWPACTPLMPKDAWAGYEFVIDCKGRRLPGDFYIVKDAKTDSISYGCRFNGLDLSFALARDNRKKSKCGTFQKEDLVIKDCAIFDTTNCERFLHSADTILPLIEKYIISKQYGPVYFKFIDGEEFVRQFHKQNAN